MMPWKGHKSLHTPFLPRLSRLGHLSFSSHLNLYTNIVAYLRTIVGIIFAFTKSEGPLASALASSSAGLALCLWNRLFLP